MNPLVSQAQRFSTNISEASHNWSLERAVDAFVQFLAELPDHAVDDLTLCDVDGIIECAIGVIVRLEERLDVGGDAPSLQRHLASGIYAMRRALEAITRWARHYHLRER